MSVFQSNAPPVTLTETAVFALNPVIDVLLAADQLVLKFVIPSDDANVNASGTASIGAP